MNTKTNETVVAWQGNREVYCAKCGHPTSGAKGVKGPLVAARKEDFTGRTVHCDLCGDTICGKGINPPSEVDYYGRANGWSYTV